jgi:VanZ like family
VVPERDRSVSGRRVSLWAPVVAYAAAIFVFSSVAYPPSPPAAITDKHVHAALYAGFALVVLRALAGGWAWRRNFSRAPDRGLTVPICLMAIVMAIAYGVTDEWHQSFVPGRTADVTDLLADAAGALTAVTLAWLVSRARGKGSNGRTSAAIREVGGTS